MPSRTPKRPYAATLSVHTTLPRPWEEEQGFSDALYDWMQRAPWLAISAAAHVICLLVLTLFPWYLLTSQPEKVFVTQILPQIDEPFAEPPEEVPPELVEPEVPLEPVMQDADLPEDLVTDDDTDYDEAIGDVEDVGTVELDGDRRNDVIGIGGGWSGKLGNRGRGGRRPSGGRPVEASVAKGLEWLIAHQDEDGKWDADGFAKHDPASDSCDGQGASEHDVGVTGLALLALLGDGSSTRSGPHREEVTRAVLWLLDQQDPESGLVGDAIGHGYLYDHGIATVALCEAYYASKSPILRPRAQAAVNLITRARNPYGAWRYDARPVGDNDTSVTGWMVMALTSARDAGLKVDSAAFDGALSWLEEVTDPLTGRVGYTERGGASSRVPNVNDQFPTDRTETMTAVGLLSRIFLGQEPATHPILVKHADLLVRALPEWDPDGLSNDLYYWYYGSYAAYQMGGAHWKAWNRAMTKAVLESQRRDGAALGSWDPIGPWGFSGGRVYSTALGVLCLEVYFRYTRLIGARGRHRRARGQRVRSAHRASTHAAMHAKVSS